MNEDDQSRILGKIARSSPRQIGIFIDDYKEEIFVKKLRAELGEGFTIDVHKGPTPRSKTLIVKRNIPINITNN